MNRRVYVLNNYPISHVEHDAAQGLTSRSHAWGVDRLRRDGWGVRCLATRAMTRSYRSRLIGRWGDLVQEFAALRAGPDDLVYAADQYTPRGACMLRAAGLLRAPTIVVFHHPQPTDRDSRWMMRGVDVAICLSEELRAQLLSDFSLDPSRVLNAPWVPDLHYPVFTLPRSAEYVLSAGKTSRDLDTLFAAVAGTGLPVRAYAHDPDLAAPDNVTIVPYPDDYAMNRVLMDFANAAVIAIPHRRTDALCGLTELNDALGFAKPVVMSRTRYLDLDVEQVGCGIWRELGDVKGWRQALTSVMGDPRRATAMGTAGRRYAEARWNYDRFTEILLDAVNRLRSPMSGPGAARSHPTATT